MACRDMTQTKLEGAEISASNLSNVQWKPAGDGSFVLAQVASQPLAIVDDSWTTDSTGKKVWITKTSGKIGWNFAYPTSVTTVTTRMVN
jgi:hypothetical protein